MAGAGHTKRLLTELCCLDVKRCCYETELLTQLAPPVPPTIFFHFYRKEQFTDELLLFRCRHLQTLFQNGPSEPLISRDDGLAVFVACNGVELSLRIENPERSIFHSEADAFPVLRLL